jgi:homoserine dehydrogenase
MLPNPMDLARQADLDVVVEAIGGTHEALHLTLAAMAAGKHVGTANKALLALHGGEIFDQAHRHA